MSWRKVERLQRQLHLAGLDLGQIENVVDQGQQVFARLTDPRQILQVSVCPLRVARTCSSSL